MANEAKRQHSILRRGLRTWEPCFVGPGQIVGRPGNLPVCGYDLADFSILTVGDAPVLVVKTELQDFFGEELQDDEELHQILEAEMIYQFQFFIFFGATTGEPGIKVSVDGPVGPQYIIYHTCIADTLGDALIPGGSTVHNEYNQVEEAEYQSPPNTVVEIKGSIFTGLNKGPIIARFAQLNSSDDPLVIRKGSYLLVQPYLPAPIIGS